MRGKAQPQPDFLTVINLNAVVPAAHPLRAIKRRVDSVLQKLSPLFDELYAQEGRASIPPEQLLKSRVLMALYSVRSERLFCEQLAYNLLWLWFLDREFSQGAFDHSLFAKNYQRVLSAEVARLFFIEIYDLSRQEGWASDAHFTADGTLIESWASLKSFVRKDGAVRLLLATPRKNYVAKLGGLRWKRNQFCRGWLITGDSKFITSQNCREFRLKPVDAFPKCYGPF